MTLVPDYQFKGIEGEQGCFWWWWVKKQETKFRCKNPEPRYCAHFQPVLKEATTLFVLEI